MFLYLGMHWREKPRSVGEGRFLSLKLRHHAGFGGKQHLVLVVIAIGIQRSHFCLVRLHEDKFELSLSVLICGPHWLITMYAPVLGKVQVSMRSLRHFEEEKSVVQKS